MAHAGPRTIEARGNAHGFGRVLAIGDFKPARDPTLGAAIDAYGDPTRRRGGGGGSGCTVSWRSAGVRIVFANFGGADACSRDGGRMQVARASGADWRTAKGLEVGHRLRRLRHLYPGAERHGRSWWLVTGVSLPGAGTPRYAVLAAVVGGGRVRSFTLQAFAAGD